MFHAWKFVAYAPSVNWAKRNYSVINFRIRVSFRCIQKWNRITQIGSRNSVARRRLHFCTKKKKKNVGIFNGFPFATHVALKQWRRRRRILVVISVQLHAYFDCHLEYAILEMSAMCSRIQIFGRKWTIQKSLRLLSFNSYLMRASVYVRITKMSIHHPLPSNEVFSSSALQS